MTPTTEGPLEPQARPPEGQTFVLEPRFDRPLHPLSSSVWLPIHARTLALVMRRFGLPIDALDERVLLGRVYGRMVPMLDRGKDGGSPPAWVMRWLLRLLPPMRRRLANALAYEEDSSISALLDAWDRTGRAVAASTTAELRGADRAAMDDAELADHLESVLEHVEDVANRHFELSFAGVYLPTGRLGLLAEELLGWAPFDIITLVQGYGAASTEHGRAIERLMTQLGADAAAAALADAQTLVGQPAMVEYLEVHGHRVNVDLARPTEAEDLALVADHLRRRAATPPDRRDPQVQAHEAQRRAISAIPDAADRARFEATLDLARRGRPYGDETEAIVLDALALVRFVALEAAERLAARGGLAHAEDIWFMTLDELRTVLRSATEPVPDLERRKREFAWASINPAPLHLGPPPEAPPSVSAIPRRYRSTVGAIIWAAAAEAPPMEAAQPDAIAAEGMLRGEAASPGTVQGTVCVLRDMAEFDRVQPGDIVVCPTTAAAWSPIFGVIGGLVTEHGGLLSHPAILSREYGLPAVLGVPSATRLLRDGTRVELDGSAGTITPL